MHRLPSEDDDIPEGQDFVYCAPTPTELDLPHPGLPEAVALLSGVPFLQAMRMLSVLAGAVYHAETNVDSHRGLAKAFYPGTLRDEVLDFLDGGRNRLAFDPRHIAALQRLAVLHAADRDEDWSPSHHRRLVGALLAVAGALPHGEPADAPDDAQQELEEWTRYLVRVGLYYERPWIVETIARSWSRYVTVADDLCDRAEACPIDDWFREDLGFTLAEQVGLGLAYGLGSGAFEGPLTLDERTARRPRPGFLENTAMAAREADAVALISADREELQAMLHADNADPMHVGWDHAVLEAKPFLRDPEGFLLLHSPPALMSWMTRGLHYRALDAANRRTDGKARPLGPKWLGHAGALGEESVRRLLAGSFLDKGLAGARLHGEIEFKGVRGRQDSPDTAVESWPDLALFEVYSGRFSREARSSGDPELTMKALRRATVLKVAEVLDRADDVLERRLVYPGGADVPKRIWPVVVLAGDTVAPTPMFWRWLHDEMDSRIGSDPRIRHALLLGLDDLEPLLALVEQGHTLFDLLGRFLASDLAEFPLRSWIAREFDVSEPRPAYVRAQWKLAAGAGGEVLYPASEKLAREIEAA